MFYLVLAIAKGIFNTVYLVKPLSKLFFLVGRNPTDKNEVFVIAVDIFFNGIVGIHFFQPTIIHTALFALSSPENIKLLLNLSELLSECNLFSF